MQQYFSALERGAEAKKDPLWGFELGKQITSAQYGLLGYLVESSSTLQEALDALLAFDKTVADIGVCQFSIVNNIACITWQPYENNQHAILRNMTAWIAMVRHITGKPLSADSIELNVNVSEPELQRLTTWFSCEIKGKAACNGIYFDAELLSHPILTKNEFVSANLYPAIQDLQRTYESPSNWLGQLQPTLHSCDLHDMSLLRLAKVLATSPRTLQRQLKSHDLSFSQLIEQERKRRFTQFCCVLNKQALSERLGYSEQASLNRAVKRWYGMSPSEYIRTTNSQ
ncbi:hypothetical protein PSECIP111951_03108 [Pseudoalteromonas holothuriae]|uniref:HTH araC/xylS-type domain-containing protein n=2 Tax=Pseudoalteromonas holothuriae TaxID=2963714 RepID=A0A9W4QYW2_9GAMM|nr:hypothetical protein PSECIP111854_02410 [Pseudoalteromonas sp. CIP111854]CAH9064340.1 hypothetical protein PSECIP111951_03108 [Pseudoalteromonas sp. CIP111951]